MGLLEQLFFCASLLIVMVGLCAPEHALGHNARSGKSFGFNKLFSIGGEETTPRPAPKQIWKIHKYHGIELRPVYTTPAPAKEYGPPAETYGSSLEEIEQEPSKSFKFPFDFHKLNFLKHKSVETQTARETYSPPVLSYSAPVEAYVPPATSYGVPVTSYGTPAVPYYNPVEKFNPPAEAYNKLPNTYTAPVEPYYPSAPVYGPPVVNIMQETKTVKFPFKKFPKIHTESKKPEPLELYSPDGSTSSSDGLDALDDLGALANLATLIPEGADERTTNALTSIFDYVDVETLTTVLEFLNERNKGKDHIDFSSLYELTQFLPHISVTQQHFDLGALIHSIPELPTSHTGGGHLAKLSPFSKKGNPKLLTLLTVLKGLKAAEIAKLGHILGLGKKNHGPKKGILGHIGGVGTVGTIAAVGAGKAAKSGLIGASIAGVKGAISKPFKHIGSKLFPDKKPSKHILPAVVPVAIASSFKLPNIFKLGHSFSSPTSGEPHLPSLPDFGLRIPKFPKISITGGYKLQKNASEPYVRISYPQRSTKNEDFKYPSAAYNTGSNIEAHTEAESLPSPVQPSVDFSVSLASVTNQAPVPLSVSSSVLKSYESPQELTKTHEAPEEPLKTYEVPQEPTKTYEAPEEPMKTYEAPQVPMKSYEASEVPTITYTAPRNSYMQGDHEPQYTRPVMKLPVYAPYQQHDYAYQSPSPVYKPSAADISSQTHHEMTPIYVPEALEPVYKAPQKTYQAPQKTYQAPQKTYQAPQQAYQSPQTSQVIRHHIRVPQHPYEVYEQTYETPQQTYDVPHSTYRSSQQTFQTPQATLQIPEASQQIPQIIALPKQKVSGLPKTAYQARQVYDEYEEDFTDDIKEIASGSYRAPQTPVQIAETQPSSNMNVEPGYQQMQYTNDQFVNFQNTPKSAVNDRLQSLRSDYTNLQDTVVSDSSKNLPKEDKYHPLSQSFTQIPKHSNDYNSNERTQTAGYKPSKASSETNEEVYESSASTSDVSIVPAPKQIIENTEDAVTSDQGRQQEVDHKISGNTRQVYQSSSTRSEKQLPDSRFSAPDPVTGFTPSSASSVYGSGYSSVNFQRATLPQEEKKASQEEIVLDAATPLTEVNSSKSL